MQTTFAFLATPRLHRHVGFDMMTPERKTMIKRAVFGALMGIIFAGWATQAIHRLTTATRYILGGYPDPGQAIGFVLLSVAFAVIFGYMASRS